MIPAGEVSLDRVGVTLKENEDTEDASRLAELGGEQLAATPGVIAVDRGGLGGEAPYSPRRLP